MNDTKDQHRNDVTQVDEVKTTPTTSKDFKPGCDLDFLEILTLILVAGKVFGRLDYLSWWAVFSPIWVPIVFICWILVYAWNQFVGMAIAIAFIVLTILR